MSDPARLPAVELARLVRAGSLSPLGTVDAVLRRIERLEPQLNACITVTGDEARTAARAQGEALAAGRSPGPLAGVTVTIKDLLNTAGVATTFGSHGFADNVPAADCIAAARLKAAGAILVAKTTTPEFSHKPFTEAPLFGRTANPWDPARTPGGSSGGAGATGAVGYGALHVGTDGGGSTRIPAAACGLVGFKASLGRVPHDQAPDSFANLSYIGPMTRTVADAAAMMDVIAGPDPRDVLSLGHGPCDFAAAARAEGDLAGLRIGCRLRLGNDLVEAETNDCSPRRGTPSPRAAPRWWRTKIPSRAVWRPGRRSPSAPGPGVSATSPTVSATGCPPRSPVGSSRGGGERRRGSARDAGPHRHLSPSAILVRRRRPAVDDDAVAPGA